MAKNKSRFIYSFWFIIISFSQYANASDENPFSIKERKDIYSITRELVNHEEVGRSNSGKKVDKVIEWTKLSKYQLRPYCGATVQYCIEKAGYKIPKDVKNPLRARDWFTQDVIYYKGHYKGLYKEKPRLSDIVGFNFHGSEITHMGFFLWEIDESYSRTFEGNTSKPSNPNIEGFFDKKRLKRITIIRKLRL